MTSPHGTVTPQAGGDQAGGADWGSATVSTSTYNVIREAILQRRQVVATYDRSVLHLCPHAIGMTDGKAQVLFYQFGEFASNGRSFARHGDSWRCIPVEELSGISVQTGVWHGGTRESRPDCVSDIDIEVQGTQENT